MRAPHGSHDKVMRDTNAFHSYHSPMVTRERCETRTLTLVLPEADWRALRAIEPDAVAWLQERIRQRLAGSSAAGARSEGPPPARWLGHDDY